MIGDLVFRFEFTSFAVIVDQIHIYFLYRKLWNRTMKAHKKEHLNHKEKKTLQYTTATIFIFFFLFNLFVGHCNRHSHSSLSLVTLLSLVVYKNNTLIFLFPFFFNLHLTLDLTQLPPSSSSFLYARHHHQYTIFSLS